MRAALEAIFVPLDGLLEAIPFAAARWIVLAFLVLAALAPFALSDAYIFLGSPHRRRSHDLRLWALAVMVPYILIYALL